MIPYHKWPVSRKIADAVNFLLNKIVGCLLLTYSDRYGVYVNDTPLNTIYIKKTFAYYVYVPLALYFGVLETFASAP